MAVYTRWINSVRNRIESLLKFRSFITITLCNVFHSELMNNKNMSSYGFLATFLNYSVVVCFIEQVCFRMQYAGFLIILSLSTRFSCLLISAPSFASYFNDIVIRKIAWCHMLWLWMCCTVIHQEAFRLRAFVANWLYQVHFYYVMRPSHEIHGDVYSSIKFQMAE